MPSSTNPTPVRFFTIRGYRVVLDSDLARLYGVPTFRFNEAVKRNADKFPEDFRFQLTREELGNLISQSAISSSERADHEMSSTILSQAATRSHGGLRKRPWVFTEHGALMAANILRTARAVEMSVYVVRAFVKQRATLATNAASLKRLADGARQRGDGVVECNETARVVWTRVHLCGRPARAA
jgi:hypothetical protein